MKRSQFNTDALKWPTGDVQVMVTHAARYESPTGKNMH